MSTMTDESSRDADSWAKPVTQLQIDDVPDGATNINVAGRRLTSPIQGFGKMWQKTYTVAIPAQLVSPQELIATWKAHFPEFWPAGNRFYGPLTGIAPGDVALLSMSLPGGMKLSTGVMVLYADAESFTLMTPQGHMFAGWITFSASQAGDDTVAQAQVLMRASDPIYEVGLTLGGHRQEDIFWVRTLTSLAARFEHEGAVETSVVCVDRRRQWRRWGNVWHSAAVRTTVYMIGAPARRLRRRRP